MIKIYKIMKKTFGLKRFYVIIMNHNKHYKYYELDLFT